MSSYRHRIKLIADSSADGDVDPDYTGTPFLKNVPCFIVPVRGLEQYRGRQLEGTVDYVIETRFYANVLPNMVAVNEFDSTQYLIRAIINDPLQREMMLDVTELVV